MVLILRKHTKYLNVCIKVRNEPYLIPKHTISLNMHVIFQTNFKYAILTLFTAQIIQAQDRQLTFQGENISPVGNGENSLVLKLLSDGLLQ